MDIIETLDNCSDYRIREGLFTPSVTCGHGSVFIKTFLGRIICFGNDEGGKLGAGPSDDGFRHENYDRVIVKPRLMPVTKFPLGSAKKITCSDKRTFFLLDDGTFAVTGKLENISKDTKVLITEMDFSKPSRSDFAQFDVDDAPANSTTVSFQHQMMKTYKRFQETPKKEKKALTLKIEDCSTCYYTHGLIITKDHRVYSTGFQGQLGPSCRAVFPERDYDPEEVQFFRDKRITRICMNHFRYAYLTENGDVWRGGGNLVEEEAKIFVTSSSQHKEKETSKRGREFDIIDIQMGGWLSSFLTSDGHVYFEDATGYRPWKFFSENGIKIKKMIIGQGSSSFITDNNELYQHGTDYRDTSKAVGYGSIQQDQEITFPKMKVRDAGVDRDFFCFLDTSDRFYMVGSKRKVFSLVDSQNKDGVCGKDHLFEIDEISDYLRNEKRFVKDVVTTIYWSFWYASENVQIPREIVSFVILPLLLGNDWKRIFA